MRLRTKLGLTFTGLWVLFWLVYIVKDFNSFLGMSLNEMGDFIAGISSALALVWLVIGYYQQGEELSNNTEALKEHDISLKKQAESLRELALATKAQAEITAKQVEAYSRSIQPVFQIHSNEISDDVQVHIMHVGPQAIFDLKVLLESKRHRLVKPVEIRQRFEFHNSLQFLVENNDGTKKVTDPIEFRLSYRDINREEQGILVTGLNKIFSQKLIGKA